GGGRARPADRRAADPATVLRRCAAAEMAARVRGALRPAAGSAGRCPIARHAADDARVSRVPDPEFAPPFRVARRIEMMPSPTVSSARPHRRQRRLIDRHFSGAGEPTGEREMREHLVDCPQCRDHYERHLRLAAVDPQVALPAGERLARGLGLSAAPPPRPVTRRWAVLALSASAACAVAVLTVGLRHDPAGLQPRGGPSTSRNQLLAYEVTNAAGIRPAVSEIRADSALAFAYANMGHRQRLMIFAVDETRHVYWYHPAWEKPGDDPVGVEIRRDDSLHELTQAVRHR